jgi:hypothetical protein
VDLGAIDDGEAAVVSIERQKEIGPGQYDGLGALVPAQIVPDREEERALLIRRLTGGRQGDVFVVDRAQAITARRSASSSGIASMIGNGDSFANS